MTGEKVIEVSNRYLSKLNARWPIINPERMSYPSVAHLKYMCIEIWKFIKEGRIEK